MNKKSTLRTWSWICFMVGLILLKGVFTFLVVGDNGQPTWDYGTVEDVPGESPYAAYQLLPDPQHVKGSEGK